MSNLGAVLGQVKSEKIKERQEGLAAIRDLFERDSAVLKLDTTGDGRVWLAVFQALFAAVANEKAAYTKKEGSKKTTGTTTAAIRRLSEAASVVRWLTERTVQRMNRKVYKALLSHLKQTMVYRGELFAPVALDYIKALRCIVNFTPHLDHLEENEWLDMVQLSFNIILGDPIRKSLEDGEEDDDEKGDAGSSDFNDTDLYEEDELDIASPSTQSRKRRRVESTPTPRQPSSKLKPTRSTQPVTLERIEFTSLLATLLQASSAPLLSPNHPYLPAAIISRLQRFIQSHAEDSSLHQDFLIALSATLSHLSLNRRSLVSKFAWSVWESLVSLWTTKDRSLKEGLVAILRVLFPFVSVSQTGPSSGDHAILPQEIHGDGLGKLWHLLDGEAESRWGVDSLSLDSLRLQLVLDDENDTDIEGNAFVARTFRSCWHFDAGQALAWAILELQADCAEKLYVFSELSHSDVTSTKAEGKRVRRDNPIASILKDIKVQADLNVRICRLQTLLFLVDRHWSALHDSLQNDIFTTLSQILASDDPSTQSWVLMCFASIAHEDGASSDVDSSHSNSRRDSNTWEPIWTHAVRRACLPNVCRAASHAAHVLLHHSKHLLTPQRILSEIENYAKDLEVQGPTFPYDSVAMFLTLCLKVASQDVRLYRMQIEEQALNWMVDTWRIVDGHGGQGRGTKLRLPAHTIKDVMVLFESICGLSKRSDVVCRRTLPDCPIVEALLDEKKTAVIRSFLLQAKVPPFRPKSTSSSAPPSISASQSRDRDLVQPLGRERRVSSYLLKSLDSLVEEWESYREGQAASTAERARRCLDLTVISLHFEALLQLNGTRSNRRVIQAACRLISLITPVFKEKRWTAEEKMLLLLGLEPLVSVGDDIILDQNWDDILLPPDEGTGVKRKVLNSMRSDKLRHRMELQSYRSGLQHVIFHSADVQDVFTDFLKVLKSFMRNPAGTADSNPKSPQPMDVDDGDDFAPIRTSQTVYQTKEVKHQHGVASRYAARICTAFLVLVPVRQSASREPTRDKELSDIVLQSDAENFLLLAPPYLEHIRDQFLNMSVASLGELWKTFEDLLKQYTYGRSESLCLTVIQALDATSSIWLHGKEKNHEVADRAYQLCAWLSSMLTKNKMHSWRVRYSFACFMGRYLEQDSREAFWSGSAGDPEEPEEEKEPLPSTMLPSLGADEDIRIRLKAAMINAQSLSPVRLCGRDAMSLYGQFKEPLCKDTENYEHMLTRLSYMANVMIVSSPMRRGSYWHVLELQIYSPVYTKHIESVLRSVASRMGLPRYSSLFESYAGQIAYSISKAGYDFTRFPPQLLGYENRRDYAEAAFNAFSPTDLLAETPNVDRGKQRFASHCKAIQRTVAEGMLDCFADVVGYEIIMWADAHLNDSGETLPGLERELELRTKDVKKPFNDLLENHVDGIVIAILRGLGDHDFTTGGAITQGLGSISQPDSIIRNFHRITRYRSMDDFHVHEPNLPSVSTLTTIRALQWLKHRVPATDSPATTFHVVHRMFAEVQRSPIVNEQLRLMNGISVWIAMHVSHLRDFTLLRSLLQWCTVCMSQYDLARAAQSIIEWTFKLYATCRFEEAKLPDILIRICCIAHDFSVDGEDSAVAMLGSELQNWIEEQALALCKGPLKELVLKALPAWPTEPHPDLAALLEEMSSVKLSGILADQRMSSNKFRLVRKLHHFATEGILGESFAQSDFWRLKNCIPPPDQLQEEDIDAFSALLVCQNGGISSFGVDPIRITSMLDRHRRNASVRKKAEDAIHLPKKPITMALMGLLEVDDASKLHVAYITLRRITSVQPIDDIDRPARPNEHKELEYLRTYPYSSCQRPTCDIAQLLQQSAYVELARKFPKWVTTMATLLSDTLAAQDPFYAQLAAVLQSDITFAEQAIPLFVQTLLQMDLSRKLSQDPTSCSNTLSSYFTSILDVDSTEIACRKCVVNIVLHLRSFKAPSTKDLLSVNKWLDIDFVLLSRNAITCGAYTTALLFLELAGEHDASPTTDSSKTEQILFDIYSHIDEPDGFYGIKTQDLHNFLVKRFHHEKQWEKAFRFHGAALEAGGADSVEAEGVLQSLHSFGFNNLAINALQSSVGTNFHSSEMTYHLGWRTETWDLPGNAEAQNFGAPLYLALRAVYRERDPKTVDAIVRHSIFDQMTQLRDLGDENLVEIRRVAQNLMCLNQVRQWRVDTVQQNLANKDIDLRSWSSFYEVSSDFDFPSLEAIMATRISLVRSIKEREEREQIGNLRSPFVQSLVEVERKCLLSLSEAARGAHNLQIALNSIVRAQKLEVQAGSIVSQEFASVLWLHKEEKLAVQILKALVLSSKTEIDTLGLEEKLKNAVLLARLGTWAAEACLEKPTDILSHFFEPAVASLSGVGYASLDREHATVFHQCAMFAEQQYHAILMSPDAIRWKMYVERKTHEIEHRKDQIVKTQHGSAQFHALSQDQRRAEALLKQDQDLFQQHNHAIDSFLEQAIEMYSRSLEASDAFDDDGTIRMCSLWFANFENVNLQPNKVRTALKRVPSRKFVFLAHQLSARLTSSAGRSTSPHQPNLQSLIVRMCTEHPFHSLYQVYCLRSERTSTIPRRQSGRHESSSQERATAAGNIFDKLRTEPKTGVIVSDVELVCNACLEWAKYPIKKKHASKPDPPFYVPDILIKQLHDIRVPVLTSHTPLDPTLKYDDCVWIERFENTYETAGGINLPKIIFCLGSNGKKYKQLFKGEGGDDMRQDAVMEQVFELVNMVLRRDRETKRRNLSVRGYTVVPLASQAGILEFVENTMPLQGWLFDGHRRYRPDDLKPTDASLMLKKKREEGGGDERLVKTLAEVRKRFKPVMRHYFTERHKTPIAWFGMRLNYSRSVATTSIVGHVLGLGDRHTSNILIDNVSGEIIHIDLGIAFDQGKLLPIPERVPFRLTPDMVDGLGTSGTQGVYQRCAEETLRVLRDGSDVIRTVLEVFRYDPLHSWTASEIKIKRVQGGGGAGETAQLTYDPLRFGIGIDMASGSADEAADRALSSVTRKLDKSLSVEYTVNQLIAEATDLSNLALMFVGWAPYC